MCAVTGRQHLLLLAFTVHNFRLVGVPGLEPGTSSLSGMRSNQLSYTPANKTKDINLVFGGAEGTRTPDILLAKQVL